MESTKQNIFFKFQQISKKSYKFYLNNTGPISSFLVTVVEYMEYSINAYTMTFSTKKHLYCSNDYITLVIQNYRKK